MGHAAWWLLYLHLRTLSLTDCVVCLRVQYCTMFILCVCTVCIYLVCLQGPLPNTCGHFWEMVWEQKSRGVVMLNRIMEKGSVS